ncbi:hypothetical protein HBA55_13000 [Pseudomaricurvus alkylphenolicus]|uniref:hypothetical protein n=1 Tax=Pseudomaricurvus alkylphenolicus TaxID=1306991 RepID=UPI0014231ECC|nr:hypothetical protein [Pseudomaricurvus alkylphenolicus]NIB40511.1 hypothetical protein [Pseudomaricurvus alkylphenolicus]
MRIDNEIILKNLKRVLHTKVVPAVGDTYVRSGAGVVGMCCDLLAQQADDAADIVYEDNRGMQGLFLKALSVVSCNDLRQQLEDAGTWQSPSIRIPDLTALNAKLAELLIELQIWLESNEASGASSLEFEILEQLERNAKRRLLILGALG